MTHKIPNWTQICKIVIKRFLAEKFTYRASALAFATLLALVPMLSVILFFITVFPIFSKFISLAQHYIVINFIPTSGNIIQSYLEGFVDKAHELPIMGILLLFITAGMLIITIEHTFNDIWEVPQRKKRIVAFMVYWLILLLALIFIGIAVFLSSYLFSLSWLKSEITQSFFLLTLFPLLINTVLFSILYVVIPNCHVNWRDAFIGGFIAAILFEMTKMGFVLYLKQFPSYELIYGAFATIPIFLLWIYIVWLIVLFGALITHTRYQLSH